MSDTLKEIRDYLTDLKRLRWCVAEIERLNVECEASMKMWKEAQDSRADGWKKADELKADNARLREALKFVYANCDCKPDGAYRCACCAVTEKTVAALKPAEPSGASESGEGWTCKAPVPCRPKVDVLCTENCDQWEPPSSESGAGEGS